MKMLLLRFLTTVICTVFIAEESVSGQMENVVVGGEVSFVPETFVNIVSNIIWKHKNTAGTIVKAIEWDEGEVIIQNPRFQGITTVDGNTGKLTITNLKVDHSGVYTIDINSKEQEQRFTLNVLNRVPKPVIEVEPIKDNPNVVYLACKYSEQIVWTNSAREELNISKLYPKGNSITVKNEGNPDNVYTCTLKNAVSEETSDPVYKNKLFKGTSDKKPWWIFLIVILFLFAILFAVFSVLYKLCKPFHDVVYKHCGNTRCIQGVLSCLDGKNKEVKKTDAESNSCGSKLLNSDEKKENGESPTSDETKNTVIVKENEQPSTQAEAPKINDNAVIGNDANPVIMPLKTDNENKNDINNEMNNAASSEVQSLEEKL